MKNISLWFKKEIASDSLGVAIVLYGVSWIVGLVVIALVW